MITCKCSADSRPFSLKAKKRDQVLKNILHLSIQFAILRMTISFKFSLLITTQVLVLTRYLRAEAYVKRSVEMISP